MSGKCEPLGFCVCRTHLGRAWRRPAHWTAAEVGYLEHWFGSASDEALSKHLGRTVVGIRLKARRLGLHKLDAGMSSCEVARLFGVDPTTVSKVWIARGLLHARRGWNQGPHRVYIVSERAVETFVRTYGQYIDVAKMPTDSPLYALAAEYSYLSLPEVVAATGHAKPFIHALIASGVIRAARRGVWWYVRTADVALIPARSPDQCDESRFRRQSVLEARRNRRKGVRRAA